MQALISHHHITAAGQLKVRVVEVEDIVLVVHHGDDAPLVEGGARVGHPMPSAETMAVVHSKMDAGTLREAIHQVYGCLKRNRALPDNLGICLAIVDGHESHASYRRHCPGCLERTSHSEHGDHNPCYHRQVTLKLVTGAPPGRQPLRMPLDHEAQRPGEDEVATATRLLEPVLVRYPRAFDLERADALYARAPFFNFLLKHRKHAWVVLKDGHANSLGKRPPKRFAPPGIRSMIRWHIWSPLGWNIESWRRFAPLAWTRSRIPKATNN
jgi:hypothetical protein